MAQVIHLGTRIVYQLAIVDERGNTMPVECPPLFVQDPTPESYLAAQQQFAAHRARVGEELEREKARAKRESLPGAGSATILAPGQHETGTTTNSKHPITLTTEPAGAREE